MNRCLIYKGLLSRDVTSYVLDAARDKPYALELKSFPGRLDDLFPDRTHVVSGEDCMGIERTETRKGIAWAWIAKNFATEDKSGFLMLPDKEARDRVVVAFTDMLIDSDPFRLAVRGPVAPVKRPVESFYNGVGWVISGVIFGAVIGAIISATILVILP